MKSEAGCEANAATKEMAPKRWMLVDDNEKVLLLSSIMIEHLTGAPVECHNSPTSALKAFVAAPKTYQVVVTDYDMPEMNGVELCRQMREVMPEQKIFLATGNEIFSQARIQSAGFSALLRKPYTVTVLEAAIIQAGLKAQNTCAA